MARLLPTGISSSVSGEERSEFGPVSLLVALVCLIVGAVGGRFLLKDRKGGTSKAPFRPSKWALSRAIAFLKKEDVDDAAREIELAVAISPLREEDVGKLRGDPDEISMPSSPEEGMALCEAMGLKVRNISGYESRWKSLRKESKAAAKAAGIKEAEPAKIEAQPSVKERLAEAKEFLVELRELFAGSPEKGKKVRATA